MDDRGDDSFKHIFNVSDESPKELHHAIDVLLRSLNEDDKRRLISFHKEYSPHRNGRTILPKMLRRYCIKGWFDEEKLIEMVKLIIGSRLVAGSIFIESPVTEDELHQLELMKRFLIENSSDDCPIGSKYFELMETYAGRCDDTILLRYLRARGDWKAGAQNVIRTANWRSSVRPFMVTKSDVEAPGRTGKARWFGYDKQGRPTVVIFPKDHFPSETSVEETMTFAYWCIEQGTVLAKMQNVDQINVIYDRRGASRSNFDLGIARSLAALQDHFAETFFNIFVIGADWLYHTLFAVVSPFMDKRTIDKIIEIGGLEDLLEFFDADQLLVQHGGTTEDHFDWGSYLSECDEMAMRRVEREERRRAAIEAADPRSLSEIFIDAKEQCEYFQSSYTADEFNEAYALSQQATLGDNDTPKPWAIGRAKWTAWMEKKGMGKEDAMRKYIALINDLKRKYAG